jgi:hypothetical protein
MKISIEDHGKVYVYELPEERATEDITMLVGRHPFVMRTAGVWYGKTAWCNHCGLCCIIKHPIPVYGRDGSALRLHHLLPDS